MQAIWEGIILGNVKGLGKEDGFSALLPPLIPLLLPMVSLLLLLFMVIAAFVAIWLFATPSQTTGRRSPLFPPSLSFSFSRCFALGADV